MFCCFFVLKATLENAKSDKMDDVEEDRRFLKLHEKKIKKKKSNNRTCVCVCITCVRLLDYQRKW